MLGTLKHVSPTFNDHMRPYTGPTGHSCFPKIIQSSSYQINNQSEQQFTRAFKKKKRTQISVYYNNFFFFFKKKELQKPVTIAVRPVASIPWVTSSAVDEAEKPDGPFLLNKRIIIFLLLSLTVWYEKYIEARTVQLNYQAADSLRMGSSFSFTRLSDNDLFLSEIAPRKLIN